MAFSLYTAISERSCNSPRHAFRRFGLSASLTAVFFISSCAFEGEELIPVEQKEAITLKASLELPADLSRTSLNDDGKVLWSKGDAFSLLSSTSNDRFDIVDGAGTDNADFKGTVSGPAPYYALYPYSENCKVEDGSLKFTLPQEQTFVNGSFSSGASPAVAVLPSLNDGLHFKNLCGILQINLCGSGKVAGLEIINLDGKPLWGDCALKLDGKQGTDEQTVTISGGSNVIRVNFDKVVSLLSTSPKVANIVVPAGSFAKGFSVRIFDEKGAVRSFLTAQNSAVKTVRSQISIMEKLKIPENGEPKEVLARGYYGDVFMDGSVGVSSRTTLPACPYTGLSLEYIASSSSNSSTDTTMTRNIFGGYADDPNGVLLYPDGKPRFRCVYVNGGNARNHGSALGETARSRFKTYVANGGSYVGSCAGAYLACTGTHSALYSVYLGIYPGICTNCSLQDSYTDIFIEPDSPLLDYYDFGGDLHVEHVYHNGGCFMSDDDLIPGAEILCRYDYTDPARPANGKPVIHQQGCAWAYKKNATTGRVIPLGSHPEGIDEGERRDLMASILLYAIDGNGEAKSKANLSNGTTRKQTNPSSTTLAGIGDGQYHHFKVSIPAGAKNFKLEIASELADYDLHLSMRKGDFAWRSEADFCLTQKGSTKTLELDSIEEGEWYVSVYCATLPTSKLTDTKGCKYYAYEGLNAGIKGVPYTIKASWE